MTFNYQEAFKRNLGLLTEAEQAQIGKFTIAIPGMGGVGGAHAIALTRQGFQNFKIADPDQFELKNFNRQYGAKLSTIGQNKVDIMRDEILAINPDCKIEVFKEGITPQNMDKFLDGADLAVDGIDVFEIEIRRQFFNRALEKNIPVITAGPLGFSTAFLIFMPGGPNFDQYFDVNKDTPYMKKLISFLLGLAPALLQRKYMGKVNLEEKRGPSSAGAVSMCAGIVAIYAIKILLNKRPIRAVPYYHQFDVMRDIYVSKKMWWGNKNPIQQIKLAMARKLLEK